ncbi:unnamed protein product [Timema podura]|uniref:Uncharacterized protein n=1 Tax=Timema podura TaxID=61482 RepID=A0ABN7NQ67_TIMPD|nr:unnamed protein product [Timema podura]
MKNTAAVVLTIMLGWYTAHGAVSKFPPNFKRCVKTDPNFDECVRDASEDAVHQLKNGKNLMSILIDVKLLRG